MTVGILIPTLDRPDSIGPLAANIAETTPENSYDLIFVLDHQDETSQEAVNQVQQGRYILCDGSYPVKTNAGFAASHDDLILPTADDVWFQPGWFEAAALHFDDPAIHVVGTNDTTPVTSDGTHATMPLIRRSYIEDPGCSWRLPGSIFWDGYHHNFVETEVCQLAQHRACWSFAGDSVIEHRHPAWGTRAEDTTDEKGNKRDFDVDARAFEERKAEWLRS